VADSPGTAGAGGPSILFKLFCKLEAKIKSCLVSAQLFLVVENLIKEEPALTIEYIL